MLAANPQTIATELHDRLSALAAQTGQMDEFGLARLRRDAEKLMRVDAAEAYTLLGGVAALQFNDQEVDDSHRAVIRLQPTATAHSNYAISLQLAQRREEAASEAAIAADLDPLNTDFTFRAIRYLGLVGRLEEAMQRIDLFQRRFPDHPLDEVENIHATSEILTRHGIPLEEVQTCQHEAFALLRERQLRPTTVCLSADGGDADEMVSYTISLAEPLETILALDAELGERLFNAYPNLHLSRFWLGFEREHAA